MKSRTEHNVHFLKAITPHQKIPGVQILRKEEIQKLIEDARKKEDFNQKEKELLEQELKQEEQKKKIRPASALVPAGVRNQVNKKIKRQERAEMAKGRKLPKVNRKKSPEKLLDQVEEMCKSEGSDLYEKYLEQLGPNTKKQTEEEEKALEDDLNDEANSIIVNSDEEQKIEEYQKQIERDDSENENSKYENNERSTQLMKGQQSNLQSQRYISETANELHDLLNELSLE